MATLKDLLVSGSSTLVGNLNATNINAESIAVNGNIMPQANGSYDLGSNNSQWKNIFANNFIGVATSAIAANLLTTTNALAYFTDSYGTFGDSAIIINTESKHITAFINGGQKSGTDLGVNAIAVGYQTTANGARSIAEGNQTIASGSYSHAEGNRSKASSSYSHAEGNQTTANGTYSHAEGYNTIANGTYSRTEGYNTIASANHAHAEGYQTRAEGKGAHAEGSNTIASNYYSHAEGYNTAALYHYSHAEGYNTATYEEISHTEGYDTKTYGYGSHAEGYNTITTATANYSHAEGYDTNASGFGAHAEGNLTKASGNYSHAEGYTTNASGNYSHAEGQYAKASGDHSHAEGYDTNATGTGAHAEGYMTNAIGVHSHTEGNRTNAIGLYSHTEGFGTVANYRSQHVFGEYNLIDNKSGSSSSGRGNYVEIVGNGTESTRSDIRTLDWDGNERLAGNFMPISVESAKNIGSSAVKWNNIYGNYVHGGVWNDYAEYRSVDITQPGRVVKEKGDGTLSITTSRLERGCEIITDTYGFAVGQTENNSVPIAAAGRVLAYPDADPSTFEIGAPVCSGPNGTVSMMTAEEEQKYPSRIIGTVSEIPTYEIWHGQKDIEVNGRIWIRIR